MRPTPEFLRQGARSLADQYFEAQLPKVARLILDAAALGEELYSLRVGACEILPEDQRDIRHRLIDAFIERQREPRDPYSKTVDLTLARIINQKLGAELDDGVPILAVQCPRNPSHEHTQDWLLEMGLERVHLVERPLKGAWNHALNTLSQGGVTMPGALRKLDVGTTIPKMEWGTLQAVKVAFERRRPEVNARL